MRMTVHLHLLHNMNPALQRPVQRPGALDATVGSPSRGSGTVSWQAQPQQSFRATEFKKMRICRSELCRRVGLTQFAAYDAGIARLRNQF